MTNRDPFQEDGTEPVSEAPSDEVPAAPVPEAALSEGKCFQVSRISLVYRYLLLLVLTAAGAFLLSVLFPMAFADRDYLIGALLVIWALALLRYWAFLLSMPYRICWERSASLSLHSLIRTRKIECGEIVAVRVSPFYQSYIRIVTSRKKSFPMLNHIDGLHDLINRIKQINPGLETKGC